jgi:hypothetical protein
VSPRVVVLGPVGRSPVAGIGWQALQYLEGLRALGCDVFYVEDTGEWPYDPVLNTYTNDSAPTAAYIERVMRAGGFEDRWAYRSAAQPDEPLGPVDPAELWRSADVLVNMCAASVLGEEHLAVPVRVYLETDPVTPQIEVANGSQSTIEFLESHTHHFTYGENIGLPRP